MCVCLAPDLTRGSGRFIHSWHWLNKHALARCHAAESSQAQVKACLMPMKAMTNREQAELYVDKVGKNLNPSGDPQSGLHSFDNPAAGLPPGY